MPDPAWPHIGQIGARPLTFRTLMQLDDNLLAELSRAATLEDLAHQPPDSYKHFDSPGDWAWTRQERFAQQCASSRGWDGVAALDETDRLQYLASIAWKAYSGAQGAGACEVIGTLQSEALDVDYCIYAWRVLEAIGRPELAEAFQRTAYRDFGDAAPRTWTGAQAAVDCLVEDQLYSEALSVLDRMDPSDYDHEIGVLHGIPTEYSAACGSPEDWDAMVVEWDARFESVQQTRRAWAMSVRVEILQALGDVEGALECIKALPEPSRSLDAADEWVRRRWDRLVAYLEGYEAGRNAAPGGQFVTPDALDELRESLRRIERQHYQQRDRSNELYSLVGSMADETKAQTELLLELPQQISDAMKQDWLAYEEFRKHRDALLRGWRATASIEAQEAVTKAACLLVGEPAWALLDTESRDELLFAQHISEAFGKSYYALAAVAWCRALERELRRALQRSGSHSAADLEGASFGQLIYIASQQPQGTLLQRIGQRADGYGLNRLRNDAAHASPSGFFHDKFRRLRSVLFHHGLDDRGPFPLVVEAHRPPSDGASDPGQLSAGTA